MRTISLTEVLAARERRSEEQQKLIKKYQRPVLSFTMNIPGPVKDSALIRRGFEAGLHRLEAALKDSEIPVLYAAEIREATGCEWIGVPDTAAGKLKSLCVRIEETHPIGRLFDMDVIDADGRKLERLEERRCIVCGAPGRNCASRRLHSLEELTAAVSKLLQEGLLEADAEELDTLATRALIDEVNTTPKPGLVDRNNNGSHADMMPETFYRSAMALRGTWRGFFLSGARTAALPAKEAFSQLRAMGRAAERTMLDATGGVNAHKGVIFTLGTVCAAIGRLWTPENPCREPERIAAECADLCAPAVEEDFSLLLQRGIAHSAGEQIYLDTGRRGARGELADGLLSIIRTALPVLEDCASSGKSRNDAGVYTLLRLIALGEDTNMIKRGGLELAEETAAGIRAFLEKESYPDIRFVEDWDNRFIQQNLSPGGCADLLAVSFFLFDWKHRGRLNSQE